MTFLSPTSWFLWLIAAALPVLLWWLFRRRRMEVSWSANYLLRRTLQATAKRNLWRQVVILTLRTLVIALVVLALAQPFLPEEPEAGALPHGDGVLHQVVLVDNSRSMSIAYRSFTREEEMMSRLRTLLDRMRHGDVCEVIPLAMPPGEALEAIRLQCPVSDAAIRELAPKLALLERRAALQDGMQLAAERFHVSRADHRHLVLLSDMSAQDMPRTAVLRSLATEFARLDVRAAAYEIRDDARANLALMAMEPGSETLYGGWQYHIYLDVRNFGDAPAASALTVRLTQGDRVLETRQLPVDLGAGERRALDLPLTLPTTPGLVTIEASLNDNGAAYDNRRTLNLHVQPRADILLVSDPAESEIDKELWRDSFYVEQALTAMLRTPMARSGPAVSGNVVRRERDPVTGQLVVVSGDAAANPASGAGGDAIPALDVALERLSSEDLQPSHLVGQAMVILQGVNTLEPPMIEALQRHVERGGGLLIAMGPSVYEDSFNDSLAALSGLALRGLMDPTSRQTRDWEYDAPYRQIEKTFDAAILRPLLADNQGPIENVRVYNHFRIQPRGELQTLVSLNNGDPLLVEHTVGRGRVLTWTSSLGGVWNTLPVRNMYPNVLYATLTRSLDGAGLPRNLAPGGSLVLQAPANPVYVSRPDSQSAGAALPTRTVHGQAMLRLDDLNAPGVYTLRSDGQDLERVEVFAEPVESDTRGLDTASREGFESQSGVRIVRDWPRMAAVLDADELPGLSLVSAFAIGLLALLLLDAILTRRWFT